MTLKNDLEVKNLCELCGNAINCPMLAGVIREECGLYKPIDKNDLVCIDKWDIDGKKAEAWIVKGKLQIRNRGTCHNIELPSVTPQEPRKGHWMGKGDFITCSCCNEMSYPFESSGYGSIYHNYCPNCGADMREVKE